MDVVYQPIPSAALQKGATFYQPDQILPEQVNLEDHAINVMTDLKKIPAVTIIETATIDQANNRMIARGVRLLFVMNCHYHIVGIVTATDLLGEKPMQHIQKHGGTRFEIMARDIMTPQEKLEVLEMADVENARVGNVVATLKKTGRQHALVVDHDAQDGQQIVRGIFSATQISRQLGLEIQSTQLANTFAEIKTSLAG
ncbi:MAG: CBS domain-containing protein [Sulfuricellaceae bacterium]|jgi:CBS-domain-containing membrane protein